MQNKFCCWSWGLQKCSFFAFRNKSPFALFRKIFPQQILKPFHISTVTFHLLSFTKYVKWLFTQNKLPKILQMCLLLHKLLTKFCVQTIFENIFQVQTAKELSNIYRMDLNDIYHHHNRISNEKSIFLCVCTKIEIECKHFASMCVDRKVVEII